MLTMILIVPPLMKITIDENHHLIAVLATLVVSMYYFSFGLFILELLDFQVYLEFTKIKSD